MKIYRSRAIDFYFYQENRLLVGFLLTIDFKSSTIKLTDSRKKGGKMKKNERKQELLRIAYNMFLSKGYDNTSIDDIINEAQIAKGTYYYYFESKEATLEEVINMMINEEIESAKAFLNMPISIPEKLVGVITSLRPKIHEEEIKNAINKKIMIVIMMKNILAPPNNPQAVPVFSR